MKSYYPISLCLLLLGIACTSVQEESINTERPKIDSEDVFYATLEQSGAADATKVYADANLQVLWNADDRISIYNYYTYGYEYAFQGTTGKTAGAFAKVADDAEFVTGNSLDKIYAVYPYSQDNDISNTGELNIHWPSTQTYKPDSFGIGSNVMVSVTTDNQLRFRNVGGYLALKLYGDNVSVISITLRGNNGEKLSGKASISCATDEDPTLSFDVSAQGSLRLNCAAPVPIGNTAEDATVFWFVVPPTQFTQGFNITVRTSDGGVFYKSTENSYDIERNTLCRLAAVEVVPGDIIPFEDANFKAYCVENFDTSGDGEISVTEALAVTTIDVNTDNIESLQGVEFFTNLTSLSCCGSYTPSPSSYNGRLNSLDISDNVALIKLDCYFNQLASLDVSRNTALTHLRCDYNQLTTLDVSNNTALKYLRCDSNQLTSLDVRNNSALTWLLCSDNHLTTLDVSINTALTNLYCDGNQLTALNVSNNTSLTDLICNNNQLTTLDVSNNTVLETLSCGENYLTTLNVSNDAVLAKLHCYNNQLTTLDVSNNTSLTNLLCYDNQLTTLDVSSNTALTDLRCYSNQLTTLDVSTITALTRLWCYNNPSLTEIWLKTGQTIESFWYDSSIAQIHYVGLDDIISFEDANFKAYCVENFDTDDDGEITVAEALAVTTINVNTDNIESLQGVEFFTNLTALSCNGSDTNGVGNGRLAALDLSNNLALTTLFCYYNQLTSLDVSNNTALTWIMCSENQLTSLDVSNNTALTNLYCAHNQLTSLVVNNNTELTQLYCGYNQLTSLDFSNNTALTSLSCNSTQLTSLDVSCNQALTHLDCEYNAYLTEIWLKTGQTIDVFSYDSTVAQVYYKD